MQKRKLSSLVLLLLSVILLLAGVAVSSADDPTDPPPNPIPWTDYDTAAGNGTSWVNYNCTFFRRGCDNPEWGAECHDATSFCQLSGSIYQSIGMTVYAKCSVGIATQPADQALGATVYPSGVACGWYKAYRSVTYYPDGFIDCNNQFCFKLYYLWFSGNCFPVTTG
jgi:hypothetical protein